MSPHVRIALTIACAALSIGIALVLPGKGEKPIILWRTASIQHGNSAMEEAVTLRKCLVWYGGGFPKFEWLSLEEDQ